MEYEVYGPEPHDEVLEDGSMVRRFYEKNGVMNTEWNFDKEGLQHGWWRTWWDNGKPEEVSFYIHGKQHGEQLQYDYDGNLIARCVFEHGTGLDLWLNNDRTLAEEREYLDGELHGYERWWSGDNHTIFQEEHFQNGMLHGILRQWNRKGRLSRGYSQYYVKGERVTKRQYERACRTDPTLLLFRAEDNLPQRPLPEAMLSMMNELV